jgi:hypothetical protein
MLMSGCVFFICTVGVDFTGGSGRTVMRAVSFFGPGEGPGFGVSAGIAAVAEAVDAVGELGGTDNRVVGGLATDGAAAIGMEAEEGGDVGGKNGNGFVGGDGVCAAGGITGASGIFGGRGAERSGTALVVRALTPFGGGLAGKLIRTVSRADVAPVDGDGRGGRVIRTVSFLGSCGSAMRNVASRNLPHESVSPRPICREKFSVSERFF